MSTVQELKMQLAKAEFAEREKVREDLLSSFVPYLGKAFGYTSEFHDGRTLGFIRYAKTSGYYDFDQDKVEIAHDIVYATYPSGKKKVGFVPIGITRQTNTSLYSSTWQLTEHHRAEIPLAQFKEMWDLPLTLAEAFVTRYSGAWNVPMSPAMTGEQTAFEPDFPYVSLEPYESTLLSGSHFFMQGGTGYVYLLTKNSRADAQRRLTDWTDRLARSAPFTEACDQSYMSSQARNIEAVRKKLGI